MSKLIKELNEKNFRTTLWVHPFANLGANNFLTMAFNFLAVRAQDALRPGTKILRRDLKPRKKLKYSPKKIVFIVKR